MVKVLVANENIEQTAKCCQYLSNVDQNIRTISSHTSIDTLNKYNKIKADVLILSSHFSEIKSTEIVDRLSNTTYERKVSNIILTINSDIEQLAFKNTKKIYGFYKIPQDYQKISDAIKQIGIEHKYDDIDENELNKLLFSMKIIVGSFQTEILKEAILECYNYPIYLNNFDTTLSLLSYKHKEMDKEAIRNAIRGSLNNLNKNRNSLQEHKIVKMFDPDRNVSPKIFLEIIVSYLHSIKNQEIL